MIRQEPAPYWPPLAAGALLALALVLAYAVTGHGLGASGLFARLAAAAGLLVAPDATAANPYLGGFARADVLDSWISWQVLGLGIGALAGSLWSGRFQATTERGSGVSRTMRLAMAFAGGVLVGAGARLARGCTSGLGLSGGAVLSVSAFVFLLAFFAAGFLTMMLVRRMWQ
jgi:hypothetical protein